MSKEPNHDSRRLCGRWVFPIEGAPIHDGVIEITDGRITSVRNRRESDHIDQDLGDVAVLPGLINAHTHLEFSDLDRPIGEPGMPLAHWIGEVVRHRRATDSANDPTDIIARGITESKIAGTVAIGEIATTPWAAAQSAECENPGVTLNDPDIVLFAEVLGLTEPRANEKLDMAADHLDRFAAAGVSPHAPYSTPMTVIQRCVELAAEYDRPVAMHVAESVDERELLSTGTGRFADSLAALGLELDGLFPWASPTPMIDLLKQLLDAPRVLIIHGNDLRHDEIEVLAENSQANVVFCPRTHAYFRSSRSENERHPIRQLIEAGVNVALGTDSRASNPDLSIWREVQFLLADRPDLHPDAVFRAATTGGAIALGMQSDYGSLTPGKQAKFIALPTAATTVESAIADMMHCDCQPIAFMPGENPSTARPF